MKNFIIKNSAGIGFDDSSICILYILGIQKPEKRSELSVKSNNSIQGNWYVYEMLPDNSVKKLSSLTIEQIKEKVKFVSNDKIIAEGVLDGNNISVSDFMNYGISYIYISTNDCLKSEKPLKRSSNGLVFIKKEVVDLSGRWYVSEIGKDGRIQEMEPIDIIQIDNKVTFWKGFTQISEGFISNEALYLENYMDYGISKVFLISGERMESEIQISDATSKGIIFIKQKTFDLAGEWKAVLHNLDGTETMVGNYEIIQNENMVSLWDPDKLITEGYISEDRILIDDFLEYGISKLYIISDKELSSELPLHHKSNGLQFFKVR